MKKRLAMLLALVMIIGVVAAGCVQGIKITVIFKVGDEVHKTVTESSTASIVFPSDPTAQEGLVFDGWYEDKDVWEQPFTTSTLANMPLKENMTLTVWARFVDIIPSYKLTINYFVDDDIFSTSETQQPSEVTLPTAPTKPNKIFDGWYTDNTFTTPFALSTVTGMTLVADKTINLYAKFVTEFIDYRLDAAVANGDYVDLTSADGLGVTSDIGASIELSQSTKEIRFKAGAWSTYGTLEYEFAPRGGYLIKNATIERTYSARIDFSNNQVTVDLDYNGSKATLFYLLSALDKPCLRIATAIYENQVTDILNREHKRVAAAQSEVLFSDKFYYGANYDQSMYDANAFKVADIIYGRLDKVDSGKYVMLKEIRQTYPEFAANIKVGDTTTAYGFVTMGLTYDTDKLSDETVQNFDKLIDYFTTHANDSGNGQSATGCGLAVRRDLPHYWLDHLLLRELGVQEYSAFDGTKAFFTDARKTSWKQAFYNVIGILRSIGYSSATANRPSYSQGSQEGKFYAGKYSAVLDGSWTGDAVKEALDAGKNYKTAPLPGLSADGKKYVLGSTGEGWLISRSAWNDPARRAAAMNYVEAMTTDEVFAKVKDCFPIMTDKIASSHSGYKQFSDLLTEDSVLVTELYVRMTISARETLYSNWTDDHPMVQLLDGRTEFSKVNTDALFDSFILALR